MHAASERILVGRHYASGGPVRVAVASGKITAVTPVDEPRDGVLSWLAPGFFDIQSNGYGGQEFSSPDLSCEHVAQIAAVQGRFGVTRFLPTVTTASFETLAHAMRTIAAACGQSRDVEALVVGIHLEGPYITREDGPRGAHPLAHCRPPDWDEFARLQDAACGRIRLVTLSAEYPESAAFIRRAVDSGVVVAIGHLSADSQQIKAAVDAGARLSTHLGNGAHRSLRRHPNYLWDQLAEDRLWASLIVDGHHLPAEVVKTFVRAKTPARCVLVSDLSGLAGLPAGRYSTQLCDLEILADGRLVMAGQDQLLAGASLGIDAGIANVMRFAGVDLPTAVAMACQNPAELLGGPVPRLEANEPADLVLFDLAGPAAPAGLLVRQTLKAGLTVYDAS
jgi:N-acetylglucosamine-6-phosphate deacetylase